MRSKKIFAVSEYTKQDILKHFKVPGSKLIVTYESSEEVKEPTGNLNMSEHGIDKPYFLYVGNAYPHKNLERLTKVFSGLRSKGLDAQLVLVGKADYFYDRLKKESTAEGRDDSVIFYGFAEESDLSDLYKNARAYVFPSLYEGFGLPPLEAMRHGTPVVASNASCLPEILGDAATYFDPEDENKMTESMERIFTDSRLREELSKKGFEQVKKFSWRSCAEKTYNQYLKI